MTLSLLPDDERQALSRLLHRASHFALVVIDCNLPLDTRRLVDELLRETLGEHEDAGTGIARLRFSQGDTEVALALHEERIAVFEELGDRREHAVTLGDIARIRFSQGDLALALALHEERIAVFEELVDRRERALALGDIARIRYFQGNVEAALSLYEEVLAVSDDLGDLGSKVSTLQRLAEIHLQKDEDGKAVQALSESDDARLSAVLGAREKD